MAIAPTTEPKKERNCLEAIDWKKNRTIRKSVNRKKKKKWFGKKITSLRIGTRTGETWEPIRIGRICSADLPAAVSLICIQDSTKIEWTA